MNTPANFAFRVYEVLGEFSHRTRNMIRTLLFASKSSQGRTEQGTAVKQPGLFLPKNMLTKT